MRPSTALPFQSNLNPDRRLHSSPWVHASRWLCAWALFASACSAPTDVGVGTLTDDAGAVDPASIPGVDLAGADLKGHPGPKSDMTVTLNESPDMSGPPPPPPPPPGPVGPKGGSVNLLHFALVGDTRPAACEDTAGYPTTVINHIADRVKARGAQFTVDLGDHMYVCNNNLNIATAQMDLYMAATRRFGQAWFMTEGNHECWKGPCLPGSTNANYVAFMTALAPIARLPYYTVDITTSLGTATLVFIADNSWDQNQATWLDATLASADARSKYTIVVRHHPEGDTSVATNPDSVAIIRRHKFALFLTGHEHLYKHMTTDNGRDMVIGNGGAPLIAGGSYYGYALVDQQQNGRLNVSMYDAGNDVMPVDAWSVGPN